MTFEKTPVDGVEIELSIRESGRDDPDRRWAARVLTSAIRKICHKRPLSHSEESLLCLALLGWDDAELCRSKGVGSSTIRGNWVRIVEKFEADSRRAVVGAVVVKAICSVRPPLENSSDGSTIDVTPVEGVQFQLSIRDPESDDPDRRWAARVLAKAIRETFHARPLSQLEETLLSLSLLGWDDSDICESKRLQASTIRGTWQRIRERPKPTPGALLLAKSS